ncbi:MAG: hypothetical protein HYU60_00015 [Magnetospirillum sp.]|nr:hypothetical protein [Magnetospirillum sp.]
MDHVRKQIRDAVKAAATGLSTTGPRVYAGRVSALVSEDMPALCLYTPKEPVQTADPEAHQLRALELWVEGCVPSSDTAIDTLDTICAEVEPAVGLTVTVSGVTYQLALTDTVTELKSEGDPTVAIARMKFLITYQVNQGSPDAPL